MFAAAWNDASPESRQKMMTSTASAAKSAKSNNCPVYACVTPLRMLLKWEKVGHSRQLLLKVLQIF